MKKNVLMLLIFSLFLSTTPQVKANFISSLDNLVSQRFLAGVGGGVCLSVLAYLGLNHFVFDSEVNINMSSALIILLFQDLDDPAYDDSMRKKIILDRYNMFSDAQKKLVRDLFQVTDDDGFVQALSAILPLSLSIARCFADIGKAKVARSKKKDVLLGIIAVVGMIIAIVAVRGASGPDSPDYPMQRFSIEESRENFEGVSIRT